MFISAGGGRTETADKKWKQQADMEEDGSNVTVITSKKYLYP